IEGLIAVDTPCNRPLPVPVVAVSGHRHTAGVTNIVVNHERAAALALEHLYGLKHRRIAVIKGQAFSSDTAVRWRAIRLAARRLGLELDPSLTAQLEGDSPFPELGYQVTRRLLGNDHRFTALFAFNDVYAIGAVRALREAGLRVPEDVSVVGFDDIPSAAYQHPGLTTVRQPLREMGRLAAQVMLKRIESTEEPEYPRLVSVDPELIVRGTTAQGR
ncbi:MAG: LacI family DNA-binding transcriptional regulator, partial [Vicinamibacteraceae bacterium]